MTDSHHTQYGMNQKHLEKDALDVELDVALAQFAAVEARAGLEERVLANLRIEQGRAPERSWWRWPALAALAVVMLLALSLVWKSGRTARRMVAHPAQATQIQATQIPTTQIDEQMRRQEANRGSGSIPSPGAGHERRSRSNAVSPKVTVVVAAPRLKQFPSPQPLSEQEEILAKYVTKYPEHAALIAQARTDELRQDSAEEMSESGAGNENSQRNK
jgi:hypothetical protein